MDEAKEILRQTKPKKVYNSITTTKPLQQVNIDLMVMDKIKTKKGNKNFAYALIIIDIYSRFLWVVPIKTKTASDTLDAWKRAFKGSKQPKNITSDSGSEFKGVFGKYLRDNNISHRTVEIGDHKSLGLVDRVIRTIRRKLRLLWQTNDDFDWITHIDRVVKEYNNTRHSTVKAKPIDILAGRKQNNQEVTRSNLIMKFNVGDRVRKLLKRNTFEKGGKSWSKTTYSVKSREGFKLILNDGQKYSPRELLKTEFKNKDGEDTQSKLEKITKAKTRKQLLKRELGVSSKQVDEIDKNKVSRPKRVRKKPARFR